MFDASVGLVAAGAGGQLSGNLGGVLLGRVVGADRGLDAALRLRGVARLDRALRREADARAGRKPTECTGRLIGRPPDGHAPFGRSVAVAHLAVEAPGEGADVVLGGLVADGQAQGHLGIVGGLGHRQDVRAPGVFFVGRQIHLGDVMR